MSAPSFPRLSRASTTFQVMGSPAVNIMPRSAWMTSARMGGKGGYHAVPHSCSRSIPVVWAGRKQWAPATTATVR